MEEKVHKSGFVALVGRPNVGKSTLVNRLVKQKIAAVSPKPQTTRRRQLGILTTEQAQLVFVDTPGVHKPVHKLGEYMNEEAFAVLKDADVILWLVDISQAPNEEDRILAGFMAHIEALSPVMLVMNKADQVSPEQLSFQQAAYQQMLAGVEPIAVSALYGDGCERLLQQVIERLPDGPPYYSEDQITDLYEREIAIDFIREAALNNLREEVPHEMAVRLDSYEDRGEKAAFISATLFVNRDSHKGIVIGKGGEMLKTIGSYARQQIEELTGRKVYLELRVKVNKNWRNDPEILRLLGYISRPSE
jgi:GTP-binding protein Era